MVSDIALGLSHAFAFWILRKAGNDETSLVSQTPTVGATVCPGPDWVATAGKINRYENTYAFGQIVEIDESSGHVKVLWPNNEKLMYACGIADEKGQKRYEVSLADVNVGGDLYVKVNCFICFQILVDKIYIAYPCMSICRGFQQYSVKKMPENPGMSANKL